MKNNKEKYANLIKNTSHRELLASLYLTQIILIILSFIVGIFLFESLTEFIAIFDWDDPNILFIGGLAGLGIVLLDLFLMKVLPSIIMMMVD